MFIGRIIVVVDFFLHLNFKNLTTEKKLDENDRVNIDTGPGDNKVTKIERKLEILEKIKEHVIW